MEIEPITLRNGRKIGPGEPCFVVAEIGQNHQGDVYTALRLIKAAHEAGVDAVKFCKRDIASDLTAEAAAAPYDNPHSFGATYGEHREALELRIGDYRHLKERMVYNKWPEVFFATACDVRSADELEYCVDPPMYKIASRDLDNLPLIDYVAQLGKPVILSTGVGYSDVIDIDHILIQAVETVRQYHNQLIILQCVSEYPTPLEHIYLPDMAWMQSHFKCPIGLSDHTPGIVASQAAALLGAVMVEKHVTLARAMKGTDHAGALEPDGIARLVRNIRVGEELQKPVTGMVMAERAEAVEATRRKLGRSLVAKRTIDPGETITEDMLTLKSPGTGLQWSERDRVVGHVAAVQIPADTLIQLEDVIDPQTAEVG